MTSAPRLAGPSEGHPGRLATFGPLLLLLPALLGTLVAVHLLTSRGPAGPPVEVDRGGAADVAGWEGSLPLPAGGRVSARLTPLHADEGRQAFDAAALRARYPELPPGAPFRLELHWEREREGATGDQGSAAQLPLTGLLEGAGLPPLVELLEASRSGAGRDPLAALLAPPASSLSPGDGLQLVLWGATPGESLSLALGDPAAGGLRVPLAAAEVPRGDLPRELASLPEARLAADPGRGEGPR